MQIFSMFEASAKLEISGTEATADVIHSRHPEEVDGASGQHGLNHRQHCGSEKSAFLGTPKNSTVHQDPSRSIICRQIRRGNSEKSDYPDYPEKRCESISRFHLWP